MSGWAALAGAANYAGTQLQKSQDRKEKSRLEEAMQKREEFLLKYRRELDTSAQKEIEEARYNREGGDLQGSPIQDKQTGAIYAFTKRGERKELAAANEAYQKQLAEEREMERKKNEASLRMVDANINQSNAAAEASRSMAEHRKTSSKESPEDKQQNHLIDQVVRLAQDPKFIERIQGDSDTPPSDEELIQAASSFVQNANKTMKPEKTQTPDQQVAVLMEKANKLKAMGVPEAEIEAALQAELTKLGLQPK